MVYVCSNQVDLDVWERFGNLGWNWVSLYFYFMGVENFIFFGLGLQVLGVIFDVVVYGYLGFIYMGYGSVLGNMIFMLVV